MVCLNLFTVRKWMPPKYWPHGPKAPRTLSPCLIVRQCIYFLESTWLFCLVEKNPMVGWWAWVCLWKLGHVLKIKLFCLVWGQLSNPPTLSWSSFLSTWEMCDVQDLLFSEARSYDWCGAGGGWGRWVFMLGIGEKIQCTRWPLWYCSVDT